MNNRKLSASPGRIESLSEDNNKQGVENVYG